MIHKSWLWQPSWESARSGLVENTLGKEPKYLANSTNTWQVIYTYIKYMAIAPSTWHFGRYLKPLQVIKPYGKHFKQQAGMVEFFHFACMQ